MAARSGDGSSDGQRLEVTEEGARHALRRGLIQLAILVVLVVALLLAVPGLHKVGHELTHMQPSWIAVAVIFEILSCLGYVLAFLQVFDRAPIRFGARVALTELAFGSAVSLGGIGSAAVGMWLLIDRGAPAVRVAERTAVLFLLTSAINVITLILAALGLLTGLLPGPSNPLLSLLPAAAGVLTFAFFLVLPEMIEPLSERRARGRIRKLLDETALSVRMTRRLMLSADWRIIGAIGYLWWDIAALGACFAAAGNVPPIATLVLAYQIGYLSNILPVPGNIGVLDGSLIGLFVIYGTSATVATAATIVYHAIVLWVPAMWGTVAFVLLQRNRRQPLKLRPSREERRRLRSEGETKQ